MKLTFRIWVFIIFLLLSALAIIDFRAIFNEGVLVSSVEANSTEFESGLRAGDIISGINGIDISGKEDYTDAVENIVSGNGTKRWDVITDKGEYTFFASSVPRITVEELTST